MIEPNGSLLGMKSGWLQHTPFSNYLIPGALLFLLNGIFPLLIIFGLIFKPGWKIFEAFNIYKHKHGAWTYSLYSGIIVLAWIIIQQLTTDYYRLGTLAAANGLLVLIVTLLPRVISYYDAKC
jgi:hypothetical protein